MANKLSLCMLLDNDKLTEFNFDSWYRKLKIILEHERILYILTDEASEEPAVNASRTMRDTYMKWLNNHMTVRCVMRAAMNDELSRKFEDAQPKEIIQMLNESFSTFEDVERYKISCTSFNAHMREETSVTDHILYMIEQIECFSKLSFLLYE